MADIKMLLQNYVKQDDDQNDDDNYNKYYKSSMLDQANPDDLYSPLEKLSKYCTSENIFTWQMVARSVVETVQSLSDNIEPSIRCELMEQLPPCSVIIVDMKVIPDVISAYILPIMVRYLSDANIQVRNLSRNTLLQLIDQDLISRVDVETQIYPVILVLTKPEESSDDFRTEAVGLMTKITFLLGSELTEQLFLERFGKLCNDALVGLFCDKSHWVQMADQALGQFIATFAEPEHLGFIYCKYFREKKEKTQKKKKRKNTKKKKKKKK